MKRTIVVSVLCSLFSVVLMVSLLSATGIVGARSADGMSNTANPATPLTSTFTYHGQLKNNGTPVTGPCLMAFRLYDDPAVGNVIGSPITTTVLVTNGLFTAGLDFGPTAFDGNNRWLELQVNCSGAFVALPRQAITAMPYAMYAQNAANANLLNGLGASAFVDIASAQTISGVKTFTGGLKFADGTNQTTAFYRPVLPGPGSVTKLAGGYFPYASVAIGADGLPVISAYNASHQMVVVHCGNIACDTGNTFTPVEQGQAYAYGYTSITIGADGLPLVSFNTSTGLLKVAHCYNVICGNSLTPVTVDSAGLVGEYDAITTGADGLGLLSYYDATNGDLKVLHCGNADCNSANTVNPVDTAGDVGQSGSITIGADGLGLISYIDATNHALKVLHCGNTACSGSNTSTAVASVGTTSNLGTSITIGADGLGLISYYDSTAGVLKVLHCGNMTCNNGNVANTVDSSATVGWWSSITTGADGFGLISYTDNTNFKLKLVHCRDVACSSSDTPVTIDVQGTSWIVVGADGLPLVNYYGTNGQGLMMFHCTNPTCAPITRVGR